MLCSPRRTRVPGWPRAPAVFTVFMAFGSNPTRGSPVVTIGTGKGVFFAHHNRYSGRAQARYPPTLSTMVTSVLALPPAPSVSLEEGLAVAGAPLSAELV